MRLVLVLPAELHSVNYAALVRQFLFNRFRTIELVLFDEQVFPEAEACVVLLLPSGYRQGPTDHAVIRRARNADDLANLGDGSAWTPTEPAGKWTGSLVLPFATRTAHGSAARRSLHDAGGAGRHDARDRHRQQQVLHPLPCSSSRVRPAAERALAAVPTGSSHLRGLVLSRDMLARLGAQGKATYLFSPGATPSPQALAYIDIGEKAGVDEAYKCRVRKQWYQVPLVRPADLLLTCT